MKINENRLMQQEVRRPRDLSLGASLFASKLRVNQGFTHFVNDKHHNFNASGGGWVYMHFDNFFYVFGCVFMPL